ncbi:MAG TPA: hypothetical protein PK948_10760 [Gemmatimonadales bacterium]|nr:hypothetical protein [Gemmatimonadales bacterium]
MVSELGGAQISTLLESLPGIANVLRSPVADALVSVMRAAARLSEFDIADADELVKYATRRGLLAEDEGDRLMAELREAHQKKLDRLAARPKPAKARAGKKPAAKRAKPKPRPKAAKKKPASRKKKH